MSSMILRSLQNSWTSGYIGRFAQKKRYIGSNKKRVSGYWHGMSLGQKKQQNSLASFCISCHLIYVIDCHRRFLLLQVKPNYVCLSIGLSVIIRALDYIAQFQEGYGRLIKLYCSLLVRKLKFHAKHPHFPGSLRNAASVLSFRI